MYITQRKKEKILKIIHITSYVFNGLFILLLLIGLCGCSSSNNNDDLHKLRINNTIQRKLDLKDNEEWNGIENYIIRNGSVITIYQPFFSGLDSYDFFTNLFSYQGLTGTSNFRLTYQYGSIYYYSISGSTWTLQNRVIRSANMNYTTTYNEYSGCNFSTDNGSYPYVNSSVSYRNHIVTNSFIYYYTSNGNNSTSSSYRFSHFVFNNLTSDQLTYVNNYIDSLKPLEPLPTPTSVEPTSILVEQSNIIDLGVDYNPLNLLNVQLYQSGFLAIGSSMIGQNALVLTGLTFKSNGLIFDTINVQYLSLNGVNFSFDNGATIFNVAGYSNYNGYIFPLLMRYQNSIDNTSVNVLTTPMNVSQSGDNYYSITTRLWTNNEYQNIEIINDEETIMRDNMTTRQLLNIQGSVSNSIIGGYSPFTLFSSAFTSISSILNIAILPGITIGLLLFMPLLVVIITLIFKLVKK